VRLDTESQFLLSFRGKNLSRMTLPTMAQISIRKSMVKKPLILCLLYKQNISQGPKIYFQIHKLQLLKASQNSFLKLDRLFLLWLWPLIYQSSIYQTLGKAFLFPYLKANKKKIKSQFLRGGCLKIAKTNKKGYYCQYEGKEAKLQRDFGCH